MPGYTLISEFILKHIVENPRMTHSSYAFFRSKKVCTIKGVKIQSQHSGRLREEKNLKFEPSLHNLVS